MAKQSVRGLVEMTEEFRFDLPPLGSSNESRGDCFNQLFDPALALAPLCFHCTLALRAQHPSLAHECFPHQA